MENFLMLFKGFQVVFTPDNILACVGGAVLGLMNGAMPGIGSVAGVALLLPLTYAFNPTTAIILLGVVYFANMYGGSYAAILLNIPGDSAAIMTALDGYPMATKKGRPGQALFIANASSFIGGSIGIIILTFFGPALAKVGLRFGPAEMASLILMAMTSIAWLLGESPSKGIISTLFGIIIASVGMDALTGASRYNFGNVYLLGGIPFIPFVIGSVGFAEILKVMAMRKTMTKQAVNANLTFRGSLLSRDEVKRMLPVAARNGFLGTFIGVLPGAGATTGGFLGYVFQKAFKSKEPLGTGAVEGIAAVESANSACAAGSFAPLLALGIPGSATSAVLLGGLIIWGLTPGPLLFAKEPDFAWGLIASLYIANIVTLAVALVCIPFLIRILSVPLKLIIPLVVAVCFVGSFSTTNSMYGVVVMLFSGILGYFMSKYKYPIAPMLLAYVLAPMLEKNMRQAFIGSSGKVSVFFTSPISLGFLIIFFALLLYPPIKLIVNKIKARPR